VALLLVIIIARLSYLQINLSDYFFARSQQNFLHIRQTLCARGAIVDCNGKLLATNRPRAQLIWQATGNRHLSAVQRTSIATLHTIITGHDICDESFITQIEAAERKKTQITLHADLSVEQLSKISELWPHDQNIQIISDFQRYYPYHTFASHILGYLGAMNSENYGKMGLEKLLEDSLRGTKGTVLNMIDSVGHHISQTTLQQALIGNDITTTLDIDIQEICERTFPQEFMGSFIVMNPADGSILSMLSRPNFDPNLFLHTISTDEWQQLVEKKPFVNRALYAQYPPGSIFKLITITAAFQEGLIPFDMNYTSTCKGYYKFAGRKYWCNNHYGHGQVTIAQSLAHSCNILFFALGRKLDIDTIATYASRFGLGKKTNIALPEAAGLVPTRAWKKKTRGESWWPGETLSISIGQSYLLTTPIQLARMISSIFTGYLVKPRIVTNEPIEKEDLGIPLHIRKFLQKSMKRVVEYGTGLRMRRIKDIKMYAKTSTAQTSDLQKRELGTQYLEHGWLVGNFTYKDNPSLTIVVLVEHAGSSSVATGIVRNFLAEYKQLMDRRAREKN
jgi:penicillin-binding protein 2